MDSLIDAMSQVVYDEREPDFADDVPRTAIPVYIIGQPYSALYGIIYSF